MTVKLVHVGLGGWGQDWEMNAIPPVSQFERVAWVDAHEPTLEAARKRLDLPADRCFTSIAESFAAVECDALLVTAPQVAHVPLAIEAMEAGKHVLCEKPFAVSVDEARQGIEVAERTGKTLMVSQQYRHYPAVRKAAQLVADRQYGPVGTVRVDFRKWSNSAPVGNSRHYQFTHPLIYDMAIHHFDLMRLVLGRDAVNVFARVTDSSWSKFEEEGGAAITIEFEGGLIVSYRGSWISPDRPTNWAGDWNLECEKGNVFFTSREGGDAGTSGDRVLVRPVGGGEEKVRLVQPRFWGRSAGLVAFAKAIETG
ncbi:MAG: Gfo/Idh/MocA family oxidoreductase, partial [Chloroflexota bacterium]|nr:Gfo/Idh/MocA family oxidoreductase [Chloroflexota bacterium]